MHRTISITLALFALVCTAATARAQLSSTEPGTAVCFGDGSGAPCPCDNFGAPGSGCANGLGVGATLSASGTADITADTLVLTVEGLPTQPGLLFQGNTVLLGGDGIVFGDGLRCCGQGIRRLAILQGAPPQPTSVSTSSPVSAGQSIAPGDTFCYQFWYRNPVGGPCGSGFNMSNGYELAWGLGGGDGANCPDRTIAAGNYTEEVCAPDAPNAILFAGLQLCTPSCALGACPGAAECKAQDLGLPMGSSATATDLGADATCPGGQHRWRVNITVAGPNATCDCHCQ